MKEYLARLMFENRGRYPDFLDWVERSARSELWGIGIMSAYSVTPYACELQGSKPGRFLKKPSEPGVNRQRYFLDDSQRIIAELKYAKYLPKKGRWITYRNFFQHENETVIEYGFDSEIDGSRVADLTCVSITNFTAGSVTESCALYANGNYIETNFHTIGDKEIHIAQKIWADTYTEREYEVVNRDEVVIVTELVGEKKVRIYPEK